jgi:hypothetical protein
VTFCTIGVTVWTVTPQQNVPLPIAGSGVDLIKIVYWCCYKTGKVGREEHEILLAANIETTMRFLTNRDSSTSSDVTVLF